LGLPLPHTYRNGLLAGMSQTHYTELGSLLERIRSAPTGISYPLRAIRSPLRRSAYLPVVFVSRLERIAMNIEGQDETVMTLNCGDCGGACQQQQRRGQ